MRLIVSTHFAHSRARRRRLGAGARSRRGLTLLEVFLAIAVAAVVSAGAAYAINENAANLKAKVAADQMSLLAEAATAYIRNNRLAISDAVPNAGDTAEIDLEELRDEGYIPEDGFAANPYGQEYGIWVRGTGNGGLQALLVTIGDPDDVEDPGRTRLASIALQAKANTGFVINEPWPDADPDLILGPYGGWRADADEFRPASAPNDEIWLASLLAVEHDVIGEDYLYRGKIPGRPDLNEMRTDLTMTLNSALSFRDPDSGTTVGLRLDDATDGLLLLTEEGSPNRVSVHAANGVLTINSTYQQNVDAATADGYGINNPYNLYVDGTAKIASDLRVGGDQRVEGNSHTVGDGRVEGDFTVDGSTTLGAEGADTLTLVRGFFRVQGLSSLDGCLNVGQPGSYNDDYCLNVARGGAPNAALFVGNVRVNNGDVVVAQGGLTTSDNIMADQADVIANNGNMRARAYFYQSDRRYKENIEPIDDALARLLAIEGKRYAWKSDGTPDYGVIAQEVEKVFPELVFTDPETGMKSVKYGNLIAPTIEAIRELNSRNLALQAEIDRLQLAR